MLATPFYIYRHIRLDTNEVFYIGKGKNRRRKYDYERAYCKSHSRNPFWQNIVSKCGDFEVEIMMEFGNHDDCVAKEKEMIELYGRRDLSLGTLVNMTDGGDGHCGLIVSDRIRKIRSFHAKKPRNKKWVESIRKARKNGGNGGVVKHGDKLPKSWKEKISKGKIGKKNPWFGKPSPVSKKVVNMKTGVIYDSIARAARAENIAPGALYSYLDGSRKNRTDLRKL